ncbi:MAG: hypothetical protein L6R40_005124 [Gallowayella cf. fulva]|nr:MAG: hypothetical protein L6R40_005124 [Xanthomendoza cf. fulva]
MPQRPAIQTYLSDDEDSRLARQLARQSTLPEPNPYRTHDYQDPPSRSDGTSMLLSAGDHTRDSMTQDLAALTTAPSLDTPTSVSSAMAARHLDDVALLELDQAGALVGGHSRRARILECPFNLLYCFEEFAETNYQEWIIHSLTHFRQHAPPTCNKCAFCEAVFPSWDGLQSWQVRMHHTFQHHQQGHSLACARPDFQLYTYLWNHRLISDADYRDIKGNSEDRSRQVNAYPTPPVSPDERSLAVAQTAYSNPRHLRDRGTRTAR